MGKVLEEIGERQAASIASQKVFFVATAPLSADHHVSVSPKAPGNSCIVLGPHSVAYADLSGSGAETAAHVLQNGRMTLMFCNLEAGPPQILRLFGKAKVLMPGKDISEKFLSKFPSSITSSPGFRCVYKLDVERISTSCGYSMPVMEFQKYRNTLNEVTEKEGKDGMFDYQTKKNSFSIDGLPSVALLRDKAPPNVIPVKRDGYIHGEKGNESDTGYVERAPILSTVHQQRMYRRREVTLWALVFAAGIAAGINLEAFVLKRSCY